MSSGTDATGRIFDLGFRRYEGPREGRRRAMLAIYKDGLRAAMGIGRGGRAKIVPWLFVGASLLPALFLALVAGAVDRLAPGFDPAEGPAVARRLLLDLLDRAARLLGARRAPSSSAPIAARA